MLNVYVVKQRATLLRFMADVCKKVNCLQPLIWEARSIKNTQIMKRLDALLKIEESAKTDTQQLKAKISHLVKMARLPENRVLHVKKEGLLNELEKLSAN